MTLVKYSPFNDLLVAQNRISHLLDSFFSGSETGADQGRGSWVPRVDIEETKDNVIIRADLPGMKKKDIQVSVENNELILHGTRETQVQQEGRNYHRFERSYGTFHRIFGLPATVLADEVEASYRDGVLEITLPKAEEVKPRQITIKS